jgi:phosphoribosylformylglycinamidine cyclo-ligase
MKKKGLRYSDAGVDRLKADEAKERIKKLARKTFNPSVLLDIGSFGSFFRPDFSGLEEPVLISSVDGVGTKLKVAFLANRYDTVGEDIVCHCIDDILTQGAVPLFFMDYIAAGRLDPAVIEEVMGGMVRACEEAGCALIGGETAEMPDFYREGEFDLAGFIVGVVDRKKVLDGSRVKVGDLLLGLPSSGLHTNGYSLARKIFFEINKMKPDTYVEELGATVADELLKPHLSYYRALSPLLEKNLIHGMAHITGGGFTDNIPRSLPAGLSAEIDVSAWEIPPVFRFLQREGGVEKEEMFKTFNMGIGMVLMIGEKELSPVGDALARGNQRFRVIGRVVAGNVGVIYKC